MLFVFIGGLDRFDGGQAAQQRHAAAGHNAFLDGRAGRVQGVFHARLLFLHFGFGRGADIDDGHAAGEFGQAFLQFLAVVIAGRLLDLAADLVHAALDVRALAAAFDDGGVFLVNHDALGAAEVVQFDALELDAQVFADELAAGEDGDVFHHGLAAVAEARRLDGADIQRAAQLVHHQRGERFAFDFLGDDQQRLARAARPFRAAAAGPSGC